MRHSPTSIRLVRPWSPSAVRSPRATDCPYYGSLALYTVGSTAGPSKVLTTGSGQPAGVQLRRHAGRVRAQGPGNLGHQHRRDRRPQDRRRHLALWGGARKESPTPTPTPTSTPTPTPAPEPHGVTDTRPDDAGSDRSDGQPPVLESAVGIDSVLPGKKVRQVDLGQRLLPRRERRRV